MATKKKRKKKTHAKKIDQKARRKAEQKADRAAEPEIENGDTGQAETANATTITTALAAAVKGFFNRASGKKDESLPEKIDPAGEPAQENGMAGVIKIVIITSTFASIAALSIFTQGLDDKGPGAGVIAVRFALLSIFALIYFLMLYMTRQSRRNADKKSAVEKK